jgi:hypothetical protein
MVYVDGSSIARGTRFVPQLPSKRPFNHLRFAPTGSRNACPRCGLAHFTRFEQDGRPHLQCRGCGHAQLPPAIGGGQ